MCFGSISTARSRCRFAHEAATEQRLGEEALDPREAFDFGVPGAEHVMGVVVVGIQLDRARGFVVDDLGVAHPFLAALGARQAAQDHREDIVAIGSHGVGPNRALGVNAAHRV
jgi:hypothetical protein